MSAITLKPLSQWATRFGLTSIDPQRNAKREPIWIGVIGDFNPANRTHVATNRAIQHAADALRTKATVEWVPTPRIKEQGIDQLRAFDGLWCAPGSPYANMQGALDAIRFARENNIPFFGT